MVAAVREYVKWPVAALTPSLGLTYNAPVMAKASGTSKRTRHRGKPSPSPTVRRLSLYLRRLEELADGGHNTVSSRQLGGSLSLTDAQVRKDLAHFGQFGRPGVGYYVAELAEHLRKILGTDEVRNVAVIGVGSLGRALLGHRGFLKKGFRLAAAFDTDPAKVGKTFGAVQVQPMDELAQAVRSGRFSLALLAVPTEAAQAITDVLCDAGIRGILNFAPVRLIVPKSVAVVPVDLAVQLEQLSYAAGSLTGKR